MWVQLPLRCFNFMVIQMSYVVYKHTNKANGKCYIGITGRANPKRRWGGGAGYSQNEYFYAAIKKYGWDGFEHSIVAEGLSLEEAYEIERRLIKEHDSANRLHGYNLDLGGAGAGSRSESTRRKNREARIRLYRETDLRQKISEGGKRRFSKPEEHEKLSQAAILRNQDPQKYENICAGNRRRWEDASEHDKISKSLKGYYAKNSDRRKEISEERKRFFAEHPEKKKTRAVDQFTTDGVYIKTWTNMTDAGESLGTSSHNISAVCNGRRKTAGGYAWRYSDELQDKAI